MGVRLFDCVFLNWIFDCCSGFLVEWFSFFVDDFVDKFLYWCGWGLKWGIILLFIRDVGLSFCMKIIYLKGLFELIW